MLVFDPPFNRTCKSQCPHSAAPFKQKELNDRPALDFCYVSLFPPKGAVTHFIPGHEKVQGILSYHEHTLHSNANETRKKHSTVSPTTQEDSDMFPLKAMGRNMKKFQKMLVIIFYTFVVISACWQYA